MTLLVRTPCVSSTTNDLGRWLEEAKIGGAFRRGIVSSAIQIPVWHHKDAMSVAAFRHRIVSIAIQEPVRYQREAMFGAALRHRIRSPDSKQRCFSSSAAAVSISEEEVQQFEEDGATVVRQLFSPDWVEKLRDAAEINMNKPGPLCDEHVASGQPGRFHDDQFLWMRHEVMQKFLYESPAGEIAKRMARAKQVRLFYDQLFVKEPGTRTNTPWHNDHSYWPLIGNQIVSLWLALDYIPKSACVQYVKGSHKWKLMHKLKTFSEEDERYKDANLDSLPDMPDIDSKVNEVELLTWDMEPGDCLVHHSFAVHGAPGISENGHRRRAYATRWVGESVLFDPRPGTMYNSWLRAGLDAKISPGSTMESELFPAVN